jgi:hypothetical protein
MGGRAVEGTGLENRQTRKRLEGSNPSPSANHLSSLVHSRPLITEIEREILLCLSGEVCRDPLLSTPKEWIRVWIKASGQEHQQAFSP